MKPPLIHIGYHKTGTTWSQRHLFDSESVGFFAPVERDEEVAQLIVAPHALDFDAEGARAAFRKVLSEGPPDRVPAFSHERLSGHPDSGGYDSRELADRIAAIFPDARILIVVREQLSAIVSSYQMYVRSGGPATLDDYLRPPEMGRNRIPVFDFRHFEYDRLVAYYRQRFGSEDVLVAPFERFFRDPVQHVREIVRFGGAEPAEGAIEALPFRKRVNAAHSPFSIALRRRLNLLFWKTRYNPGAPMNRPGLVEWYRKRQRSFDRVVPGSLQRSLARGLRERAETLVGEMVGDRYRESNRRLAGMVDFDLEEYGYPL